MPLGKKGIFFSIDAILAVSVALLFMGMAFLLLQRMHPEDLSRVELLEYMKSVSATLEARDAYSSSVLLQNILENQTRTEVCFHATVFTASGTVIFSAAKQGCGTVNASEAQVYRSFVRANREMGYTLLRGWYTA